MYRLLDLFSGIGGFSLGLERSGGFKTVAFCEIEPFPRRVLKKHWPDVPIYEDVRTLTAERLAADGISVDAICGGFPCQDLSVAGRGAGLDGERSGLWSEIVRLVGELRPRYIIVENVAALLGRGLGRVLGDLAALGYNAEWDCIPACAIGAPHRRDRIWIVAHANPSLHASRLVCGENSRAPGRGESRHDGEREAPHGQWFRAELGAGRQAVADAQRGGLEGGHVKRARPTAIVASSFGRYRGEGNFGEAWWAEPDVGRMAHGVPAGMDRIKSLGNAVVPQIPELIGRAIMEAEGGA